MGIYPNMPIYKFYTQMLVPNFHNAENQQKMQLLQFFFFVNGDISTLFEFLVILQMGIFLGFLK